MRTNDADIYKQPFGGSLGDEFQRVWKAIKANQVIPAEGMKVSKTTGGTILRPKVASGDETIVQQGEGIVIQTAPLDFGVGFATHRENELWYVDINGRIIAKPPIAERDYDSLDTSTQNNELFWGTGGPFYPRGAGDYGRGSIYAYPYPWRMQNNMGAPGSPSSTGWKLSGDTVYTAPVFVVRISPPMEIFLLPEQFGGIFATGVDPNKFAYHTPEIVSREGLWAIRCSYLDMNLEGRYWTRV